MRLVTARMIAVAVVVLVPAALTPLVATPWEPAPLAGVSAQAAVAAPLASAGAGTGIAAQMLVPERSREIADDSPRLWLRSVSTAPMRPRLPSESSAPRHKSHLTWNARLRIDEPAPDALAITLATPNIRFATGLFLADVAVRSKHGHELLRVAFVDPSGFRVFTPKITGEAEPLWHGVREGEALLTHHTARRLGLRPGDALSLSGHPTTVVGAASLGSAHVADVVVSAHVMDRRQFDSWATILAGVHLLREIDTTVADLQGAGVGEVRRVRDEQPYTAELTGDHGPTVAAFEPFTFVPARERGWLQIDPAWIERNISRTQVPIIGEVVCHRLMIPQLRAALTEVQESGLSSLLDPDDYGGCFAARHIGRNPQSSLSMHAWGLAIDFNVHTNLMGQHPRLDPRIIEIFERHGFNWGGRWRTPDGMHFELGTLQGAH